MKPIEEQLKLITNSIKDDMLLFAKDITEEVFDKVIDATPVKTGNAAYQYQVSFNGSQKVVNLPTSIGGDFTKIVSKARVRHKINSLKLGKNIHLTNSTHYIVDIMQHGKSPKFQGNWTTLVQAISRAYSEV